MLVGVLKQLSMGHRCSAPRAQYTSGLFCCPPESTLMGELADVTLALDVYYCGMASFNGVVQAKEDAFAAVAQT